MHPPTLKTPLKTTFLHPPPECRNPPGWNYRISTVPINCFCRHVPPTPCIRKNDFPLPHCSTRCCVSTRQLYSNAGALSAPAFLKLLKFWTSVTCFFFRFQQLKSSICNPSFLNIRTRLRGHGCSFFPGGGIAVGTRVNLHCCRFLPLFNSYVVRHYTLLPCRR